MRKTRFLMAVIAAMIIICNAQAASGKQISESEARSLARQYLHELSGMNEEDYQTYSIAEITKQEFVAGVPVWFVLMDGDDDDPRYATNTYSIQIHRLTGECVGMGFPTVKNPVTTAFHQLQKEQHQNDLFVRWTIQEKYEFKQTFEKLYQDFLLIQSEKNYLPVGDHILKLIQTDYRLPDASCISQEDAMAFAKTALLAAGEVTDAELTGRYIYAASFLFSYEFNPRGQLVWKIFFIPAPPQAPDYGYYVEVDAHTGQTVGITHQIQNGNNLWACVYE